MTGQSKQTDYSNGKVYVIISPNCDLFYYGSTVEVLKHRFDRHKKNRDCSSVKIIDAGDADIYEIETYPCSCVEELEDREAFYILNDWDGCVNEQVPGSYRRAGGVKAYQKKYNKVYRNNPEVKTYRTQKIPCNVCSCMISRGNISTHQKSKTCQKFLKNELNDLMNDMITEIEKNI